MRGEALLKLTAAIGDDEPRPVGRRLHLTVDQSVGPHRAQLVAQFEGERPVLVEDEAEVERHPKQLVQQVGGLLQMRLAAPASALVQPTRQSDENGFLRQTVHELTSSSRACSASA